MAAGYSIAIANSLLLGLHLPMHCVLDTVNHLTAMAFIVTFYLDLKEKQMRACTHTRAVGGASTRREMSKVLFSIMSHVGINVGIKYLCQ